MAELKEVFEMVTKQTEPDLDSWKEQERRQRRAGRSRRIGALAVAAAIAAIAVVLAIRLTGDEPQKQPANPGPEVTAAPAPEVDSTIDLNTGEMTPLPTRLIGTNDQTGGYAVRPDGQQLAYVGVVEDGNDQIFVADIDGTHVKQVTHDPTGQSYPLNPSEPAWSPDGATIAYLGHGTSNVLNLFVVDVASGESTQVTDETSDVFGTQFTQDGASLVYAGGSKGYGIRTVPITGGKPTLLVGGGGNKGDAGNGSLSPDGSLLSYAFNERVGAFPDGRYVANADGSEPRKIVEGFIECSPAGGWSPDGGRLACIEFGGGDVYVVDVTTGASEVVAATADGAIWLDDHTLLIDV